MSEFKECASFKAELLIDSVCKSGRASSRDAIIEFEAKAQKLPQVDIPVKHYIHGGMYAREITIPKGCIITGQIYKFDHLDIMISGDVSVSTDNGERKRLTGYNCLSGLSGKKRAGFTHEETKWITVHPFPDRKKTGDEIQELITAATFGELEEFEVMVNQQDYKMMVDRIGMTEAEISAQVNNQKDLTPMPSGFDYVYTSNSPIHGVGLFTSEYIGAGQVICQSRIGNLRTPAGRYTNHALNPNAEMVINGNDVDLVSIKPINDLEEITVNYSDVLEHRLSKGDLCPE